MVSSIHFLVKFAIVFSVNWPLEQERRYEPTEKGQLERKDTFSELWRLMIIGYELQMESNGGFSNRNPQHKPGWHCLVLSNRKRSAQWSRTSHFGSPCLDPSFGSHFFRGLHGGWGERRAPTSLESAQKGALFGAPPAGKDRRRLVNDWATQKEFWWILGDQVWSGYRSEWILEVPDVWNKAIGQLQGLAQNSWPRSPKRRWNTAQSSWNQWSCTQPLGFVWKYRVTPRSHT